MALSPWPTEADALTAAKAQLQAATGKALSDADLERLGATAAATVEREAAAAPQAVKDEAVIRFAGYLSLSGQEGAIAKASLGPQSMEYNSNHAGAFRLCGAKALLSPWKVRRGGLIG